jgi:hypothetical protein
VSDDFRFQASVKVPHGPDNYRDSMINVRGNTAQEFAADLTWLEQNAATVAAALQAIHASVNVQASFPGSQNVQPAAVQENHPQAPAPQAPQQSWSQQGTQQAPAGGPGPAPYCAHGEMKYREAKPGSGKNWKAWFCPTPQGTPGQCKPNFI